jgi:endonuclease/exonuclease/phosphatase family metal-dependent hydrolase
MGSEPPGPPPESVQAALGAITSAADAAIPKKTATNLLIGTWNVRAFDAVTNKWRAQSGDTPRRDLGDVACITEIVRRFDVVAVQEVRRSAEGFQLMLEQLGRDWAFLVTDVTEGAQGNNERLAFVYDTTRLRPSGLACELVVAAEKKGLSTEAMTNQFARTPYAVSFARDETRFTLITLHVAYGKPAARLPELKEIAQWLKRWAGDKDPWGSNLVALGDFNIDRSGDPLFDAFTSTGLTAPDALNKARRTIFDGPDTEPDHKHFYDQIAWFPGKAMTLPCQGAGTLDFVEALGTPKNGLQPLSWKLSDHYPLWCEFGI